MKNKSIFKIGVIFLLISLFLSISYKLYKKPNIEENVTILQDFLLETVTGEMFTKHNLVGNSPVIIGYLEHDCGICKDFINHVSPNKENNYLIIFDKGQKKYIPKNLLKQLSNLGITPLFSDRKYLFEHFGIENPSTFLVFNDKRVLIKRYVGAKDPIVFLTNPKN